LAEFEPGSFRLKKASLEFQILPWQLIFFGQVFRQAVAALNQQCKKGRSVRLAATEEALENSLVPS
jgi:hypothetical protein